MYRPDPQGEFAARVTVLTAHGIQMPAEYDALRRRLDASTATTQTTPVRDKLVGIIVDGVQDKNSGLASVYAAAIAEALDPGLATPVRQAVFDTAHRQLVRIASAA